MNKRKLHHLWKRIRPIRPWYLLAAGTLCLLVSVFALRENYVHMENLRDAVYTADKNNGDVKGALTDLQRYVTAHMNTDLSKGSNAVYPPIQLKYTYERLREADLSQNNSQVYTQAQAYCEQQDSTDFSGRNRVPCIESYVQNHGVVQKQIPDAMYKFDFISPTWSPDLAGVSLLLAGVLYLAGIGWWGIERYLKGC